MYYETAPSQETLAGYVQAGILVLDQHRSGWRSRIDVNRLDIGSGVNCVVGQLHTYYTDGIEALYRATHPEVAPETDVWFDGAMPDWSVEHGFQWPAGYPEVIDTITQLWREELTREQSLV